ncbi:Hypothetical predicted protein [Pelobates cultripes]|uniref:Uncharacterized protein n=1 Tax=Pelobates cultripes TaxID=61616 RepID=A0AAD1TDI7_PELCU|nr:Hypothetical predicted protein [Pelobates cultripes]
MATVRDKTIFSFESAHLTFYQDLSMSMLQWRTVIPLTNQLRSAVLSLTVLKDGSNIQMTSMSEATTFLQALRLPSHTDLFIIDCFSLWDPERTASFIPRSNRGSAVVT